MFNNVHVFDIFEKSYNIPEERGIYYIVSNLSEIEVYSTDFDVIGYLEREYARNCLEKWIKNEVLQLKNHPSFAGYRCKTKSYDIFGHHIRSFPSLVNSEQDEYYANCFNPIVTYHDNYLIHEKVVTGMRRENNKLLIYLDGNEHCKGKIIYTKNPRVYYCTENWFEESFKVQIPFKVARKTFLIRKGEGNE